jgi:hypothetical protein
MKNQSKERTRGGGRKNAQDKDAHEIPSGDIGTQTPDGAAPVLQSEDDELLDEDTTKKVAR